ncbi:unnamed protein product [Arabidopsis arenosa]|uniref:Uncharacterized protein n=1 Tax=Arabidopsis arenosa TaxID=38785 RepID=A0A8S2AYC4_ARAAE|nr:unnamed protein product [Arabidopsis arenosa]
MSEILFEFSCNGSHQVMECGVHILRDEAASTSEVGNTNDHTDGAGDYEPESVPVPQVNNIKSSRDTDDCWVWLRKLGLRKKKKKK